MMMMMTTTTLLLCRNQQWIWGWGSSTNDCNCGYMSPPVTSRWPLTHFWLPLT